MADTDEQLRAKLDQGMIYAPSKWASHALRVADAYAKAYATQAKVLKDIEAKKRAEAELASFMISLILPSVVGGFLGAIIAGKSKQAIDLISDQASKFRWGVAADVAKTVASDMAKAEVRLTYEYLHRSSGWEPSSISPTEFLTHVQGSIAEFVTAAADAMNNAKTGRSKYNYRDVVSALYYGPFIREAPEIQDLWEVSDLAPVLEVFLWVEWANHRDTKWWLDRIMRVTEKHDVSPTSPEGMATLVAAAELKDLNPILERFDRCRVPRQFITQGMPDLNGYRFLNILWVRHLAPRYKGTLLGDLLDRLADNNNRNISVSRRPKSYPLM
jgi:hypothetical protein